MSENGGNGDNQNETVESLKTKIAELEAENEKLRQTLEKGAAALEPEIEEQKVAAIKAITEKTNFSKSELEKMKLPALRLILKTIERARTKPQKLRQNIRKIPKKNSLQTSKSKT